jgi:hypothetical protein
MDPQGGEGGVGEGGIGGGGSGTAGAGGVAGTGGTAGEGDGGSSMGGTAGTNGRAGADGRAGGGAGGVSGSAGTSSGGTGGAPCTPTTEICDGIDNDCGRDIDEGGVCPSDCEGGTFKGRTFLLCTSEDEEEWIEAREFCMELNDDGDVAVAGPMTLVQITSAEENQFLVDWIDEAGITDSVWHGANDRPDATVEGQWVWDRGDQPGELFYTVVGNTRLPVAGAYHDWLPGQPTYNGVDCGTFDAADNFHWDDGACTQGPLNSFICGEIP